MSMIHCRPFIYIFSHGTSGVNEEDIGNVIHLIGDKCNGLYDAFYQGNNSKRLLKTSDVKNKKSQFEQLHLDKKCSQMSDFDGHII